MKRRARSWSSGHARGEEVVIARDGKPAARLVAIEPQAQGRRPIGGDYAGKIVVHDDFNDPMPEDFTAISFLLDTCTFLWLSATPFPSASEP